MKKKPSRTDLLQNAAIILLSVSALVLLTRTPLFGSASQEKLPPFMQGWFSPSAPQAQDGERGGGDAVLPLRLMLTNEFARRGVSALTTADADFTRAQPYLAEALRSLRGMTYSGENVFLEAMRGPGLYCDFLCDLPMQTLADRLAVPLSADGSFFVRRALLVPTEAKTAALYLMESGGSCRRFETGVDSASLSEFLSTLDANDTDFAADAGERYARLSPYTFVSGESLPLCRLEAESSVPDQKTLLRLTGFNPHTENYYTDAGGTLVVREGDATLYLYKNGSVLYEGGPSAPASLYAVPAANADAPSVSEAIDAVRTLASSLLDERIGEGRLYCSGTAKENGVLTVDLDVQIDGVPVRLADGSHAVHASVVGGAIAELSVRFRSYVKTDALQPLLPAAQAASIADGRFDRAELRTVYVDNGGGNLSPCWIAE